MTRLQPIAEIPTKKSSPGFFVSSVFDRFRRLPVLLSPPEVISMIEHIKIHPVEYLKVYQVIRGLARSHGVSMIEAWWIIQRDIQAAWDKAWMPYNLRAQWEWQELFPADRCPTVAEFIVTIAREMMAGRNQPYLLK